MPVDENGDKYRKNPKKFLAPSPPGRRTCELLVDIVILEILEGVGEGLVYGFSIYL